MLLPSSGTITLDDVRDAVGLTGDFSMGSTYARLLARKESGTIYLSDFYSRGCEVYEVTVATHPSVSILIGYVKEPAPEAEGSTDVGSVTPVDTFKGARFSSVSERENAETFAITFPTYTPIQGSDTYLPAGFFYAIHINGEVFYEADASISGSGGGITSYHWAITRPFFSAGQTYTMRIFY